MRLSIGTRLRLSLALLIGIVLLLGAVGYRAMHALAQEVKGSLGVAVAAAAEIDELRLRAHEARLTIAAAAAAATTSELATAGKLRARFDDRAASLASRKLQGVDSAGLSLRMAEMVSIGSDFARANAAQQWSRAAELSPRFEKAAKDLEITLDALAEEQRRTVARRLERGGNDLRRSAWLFLAGISAWMLLAAGLEASLRRSVVKPLNALAAATARIVEHGDLAQEIELRSGDELGELARCFRDLVEKLRQIPLSLQQASEMLSTSVEHLGTVASQQITAVSRHAMAVQETSATAGEIRQTSAAAAQRLESLLGAAVRADAIRTAGESSVERTLATLGEIASSVSATADRMSVLKERMRQIDAINLTVKDLADQSNMLALNAAIEAVRSGEHGRGFAVVAREIRSLADQSIAATTRVREILQDISAGIEEAVRASDAGRKRASAGLSEAQSSGATLRELSEMVKSSADAVRQIASTMTQQDAGIGQIFSAVRALDELTGDTRKQLDTTESAIARLREVAARVSGIVSSYRV